MADIRWIQRFNNFGKALGQLKKFIDKKDLNELEKQGLVQAFEYTHELAWNTLKDFLESRGTTQIYGSKDATREAFKMDLVTSGDVWMSMIEHRNLTSYTYNEETTQDIALAITGSYFSEFQKLHETLRIIQEKEVK